MCTSCVNRQLTIVVFLQYFFSKDEHLKIAVDKVKSESKRSGMWERIAEQMQIVSEIPPLEGFVFKGEMCRTRWSHYVGPMQKGLTRGGAWTAEEVKIPSS